MRTAARLAPIAALVIVLALGLAACGSSSSGSGPSGGATTSQESANAAFCSSLADLKSAAGDLTSLDPANTTLTQLSTAVADLSTAWTSFSAEAGSTKGVDTAALTDAWNGLKDAAAAIPGSGDSPSEAIQSLKPHLTALQDALDGLAPECQGIATTGTTTS
jgi:hypothetical protein